MLELEEGHLPTRQVGFKANLEGEPRSGCSWQPAGQLGGKAELCSGIAGLRITQRGRICYNFYYTQSTDLQRQYDAMLDHNIHFIR